jgi:SAM-dependent methyltransferase
MDQFPEFLESANSQFPGPYQNRLRKYPLKDHDLSALPQNQFGFVFSWGHFNYVSLDTITQVLKQLTGILRPGGVFMFSYNDGDTPAGAGMAENFAQTYIPKSLLVPTCLSLGYEVTKETFFDPNISWLEIKRPGELSTIKAHQAMGKITARTD